MLVTEFIHAVLMADYIKLADRDPEKLAAWLTENNVDPRRVARRLIHSIFRQLLENNLYHGDLHPGNIVLLRDNRIALIDFGSTNFTEREYLAKFGMFIKALAMRDYAKGADLCLLLTASLPNIDTDQAKEELVGALRAWATRTLVRELPYHDKSLDNATIQVVRILVAYRCTMAWAWLRIHRALTTLDTSLIYLYPDVNYTRMLQRYFQKAEGRRIQAILSTQMVRRSINSYATALDIQDRVNDYTLFQGILVRRHAQVFRGATSKVAALWSTLAELVWVAVAALGTAGLLLYLGQRGTIAIDRWVGPQLAGVLRQVPPFDPAMWIIILGTVRVHRPDAGETPPPVAPEGQPCQRSRCRGLTGGAAGPAGRPVSSRCPIDDVRAGFGNAQDRRGPYSLVERAARRAPAGGGPGDRPARRRTVPPRWPQGADRADAGARGLGGAHPGPPAGSHAGVVRHAGGLPGVRRAGESPPRRGAVRLLRPGVHGGAPDVRRAALLHQSGRGTVLLPGEDLQPRLAAQPDARNCAVRRQHHAVWRAGAGTGARRGSAAPRCPRSARGPASPRSRSCA